MIGKTQFKELQSCEIRSLVQGDLTLSMLKIYYSSQYGIPYFELSFSADYGIRIEETIEIGRFDPDLRNAVFQFSEGNTFMGFGAEMSNTEYSDAYENSPFSIQKLAPIKFKCFEEYTGPGPEPAEVFEPIQYETVDNDSEAEIMKINDKKGAVPVEIYVLAGGICFSLFAGYCICKLARGKGKI